MVLKGSKEKFKIHDPPLLEFHQIPNFDFSDLFILYQFPFLSSNWDWDLGLGTGTWDLGPGNRIENRKYPQSQEDVMTNKST